MAEEGQTEGKVRIVCGASTQEHEVAGRTIAEVRQMMGEAHNISPDTQARVSGNRVEEDYLLQPGDTVEFIRRGGRKEGRD